MKKGLKTLSVFMSFLFILTAMITVYPSLESGSGVTASAAGPVISTGKQIKAKWNDLWSDYNNGIRESDTWQSGSKINDGQIATVCPSNLDAGSQSQYHYSRNTRANTNYEFYIDLDLGAAYDLAGGADYGTRAYFSLGGVYGHGITDDGIIYQSYIPSVINYVNIYYSASSIGGTDKGTVNVKDTYKQLSTAHEGGWDDDQLYCFYDNTARSGVRYIRIAINYDTPNDEGAAKQMRNIMVSEVMANLAQEPLKYTVKYDANGGDGENIADSVHNANGGTITTSKYVKNGAAFKGWSLKRKSDNKIMYSADGTSNGAAWYAENSQPEGYVIALYQPGASVAALTSVNNDVINAVAQWSDFTYTVKFVSDEGVGSLDDVVLHFDDKLTFTAGSFTMAGSHLFGWSVHRSSDDKSLYWEGSAGTPAWYKDGEQPEGMIKTVYPVGSTVSALSGTDNDVITCKAVWTVNTYTVRYVANGGLGSIPDLTMKYGSSDTLSTAAFFRVGYNFAGWALHRQSDDMYFCLSGDGLSKGWYKGSEIPEGWAYKLYQPGQTIGTLTSVSNDVIFCEAQWTPYKLTINFDLKGGSGPFGPAVIEYDSNGRLPKYEGTKKGAGFIGWECNGVNYANEAYVGDLLIEDGLEYTFNAVWNVEVVLGDVNGDGEVDSLDATMLLKYDAGMIDLEDTQLLAGDVNGDGEVDSLDAVIIFKYDAGIIDEL